MTQSPLLFFIENPIYLDFAFDIEFKESPPIWDPSWYFTYKNIGLVYFERNNGKVSCTFKGLWILYMANHIDIKILRDIKDGNL